MRVFCGLILGILLLIAILGIREEQPFTGYVVGKEYIPAHLDNENPLSIHECIWIPVTPPVKIPQRVRSRFIIHVANKDALKHIDVDSMYFVARRCGEKITIK